MSRDSSVSIATGYGMKGRGSINRRGRDYSLLHSVLPAVGPTQPPIQWLPLALSSEVKLPGREACHSPTGAEIKNGGVPHAASWRGA
jgi:hypothetical protein